MTSPPPRDVPREDEFPLYNPAPSGYGEPTDNPAHDSFVVPSTIGPQPVQSPQPNRSRRNVLLLTGAGAVGLVGAGWLFARGGGGRTREGVLALPTGATHFKVEVQSGDVTINRTGGAAAARWSGRTNSEPVVGQSGGVATVSAGSADLALDLPAGSVLEIIAKSGDIRINDAALGDLTLATTSGDIRIEGTSLDNFGATTTSGDLDVKLTEPPASVSITTTSGEVNLRLPGRGYRYETDTRSGDVDIPGNTGTVPVTIRTTSGDIDVEEA